MISQQKFSKELLAECDLDLTKKALTLLHVNTKLQTYEDELLPDLDHYRSLVGKLNFLTHTRSFL